MHMLAWLAAFAFGIHCAASGSLDDRRLTPSGKPLAMCLEGVLPSDIDEAKLVKEAEAWTGPATPGRMARAPRRGVFGPDAVSNSTAMPPLMHKVQERLAGPSRPSCRARFSVRPLAVYRHMAGACLGCLAAPKHGAFQTAPNARDSARCSRSIPRCVSCACACVAAGLIVSLGEDRVQLDRIGVTWICSPTQVPAEVRFPLPSSDSSQNYSTCSSLPLVFGWSDVAC